MRRLFFTILAILTAASIFTLWINPEVHSPYPIVYWVTDPNPARDEQIALFHQWLEDNDYPRMTLRLDTANHRIEKKIIQGVSGVAGDVMDVPSGGGMRYFRSIGLLRDITEPALQMGFDPSQTFSSMLPEITYQGRQYMFPCNVYTHLVWVNLDSIEEAGLPPPPLQWDLDTFEEYGKRYVAAVNPPDRRQTRFFINTLQTPQLRRSLGLDTFNETLTACILDDPRNVKILERIRKWREVDRILPTAEDEASFATEAGYEGPVMQLFNAGNYAMFLMGRYALIQLREFGNLNLSVSHPPHGGYPNVTAGTRSAGIYTASEHPELAYYFLKFLASEEYNMQIVRDGDALPPNPAFTRTEAFLRPPDYPNEWGLHERFSEAVRDLGIGHSYSPYVLFAQVMRNINNTEAGFTARVFTAEEAARITAERINREIQRTLREHPEMREDYERRLAIQAKIDERRAAGLPVPLEWIENPFYQRYYANMGWLEQ